MKKRHPKSRVHRSNFDELTPLRKDRFKPHGDQTKICSTPEERQAFVDRGGVIQKVKSEVIAEEQPVASHQLFAIDGKVVLKQS